MISPQERIDDASATNDDNVDSSSMLSTHISSAESHDGISSSSPPSSAPPHANNPPSPEAESPSSSLLTLQIQHRGQAHSFSFAPSATITDLSHRIHSTLSIPPENQKYMITPKIGLVKFPFPDPPMALASLVGDGEGGLSRGAARKKKIVLMGSTSAEVAGVDSGAKDVGQRGRSGAGSGGATGKVTIPSARPSARARTTPKTLDEQTYTFTTLRPLPYLPHPERSLAYLARLRDDPGIKATMRSHRWTVPVLTEMNPAEHTTHESRTLGLNRNRGEVIELRLRTDAYDGYRDYKTIRKTLCHELAHNVHGEHDQDFWRLCREVEREVERNDYLRSGRTVGEEEYYHPPETDEDVGHVDGGGWVGGEYVLGGSSGGVGGGEGGGGGTAPLSRRDILARAAEERIRLQRAQQGGGTGPGHGERSGSEQR